MGLKDRATRLLIAAIASTGLTAYAAEPESIPGEFIVKMKSPISENKSALNLLSHQLGAFVKTTIVGQNILVVKRPSFETTKSAQKELSKNPMVKYVEPNYVYRINRTPDDPMLGQLWGMTNTLTPGVDISAQEAWDIETGSKDVLIAVIDTGVNYNHPDLQGNMWTNEAEANGIEGVDDDGNGVIDDIHGYNAVTDSGDPLDDHGHGSHCSGTIGASGNDGKGIVGVAWNTRIMGVKFLTKEGSGSLEGAIKGIDYATKMGAKIMSNSWGGGGFSQALLESIQRANDAGALFVAAAGNESNNNDSNPTYPATYDVANVLTVAAVDNKGQMASFSNYGRSKVHVGAPGVAITSSTAEDGGYDTWSGTSMATPHVSGIAALVMSHEPNLTASEVRNRIITTSKRLPALRGKVRSAGMANAFTALTNVIPEPDLNDPTNWLSVPMTVSSAHPYKESEKSSYSVRVEGAKQIALYFEKFDTEKDFDFVIIKDENGNIVEKLSGSMDDTFSSIIEGSSATIEFQSDDSVNKYGFDLTKVGYR